MAREEITVRYAADDVHLDAHISLERDDGLREEVQENVAVFDSIELTPADLTKPAFTKLLAENARADDELWLWCYRPAWLKLLALLDVKPPLPAVVDWPLENQDD